MLCLCRVDAEQNVKIVDFGLSRDIHTRDYYRAGDKNKPMPLRWMALESLEDGVYNSKTDVVIILFFIGCLDCLSS